MSLTLHPEATDDPQVVLWHLPRGTLPAAAAPVGSVPEPLAAWLRDGRVVEVSTDPRGVRVRLAAGLSWREHGPALRAALVAALEDPSAWSCAGDEPVDEGALTELAHSVLAGQIAPLAASHGGRIELVEVRDAEVRVRLHGACHGCAASETTLRQHFEHALREREPRARVRAVGGGPVTFSLGELLHRIRRP